MTEDELLMIKEHIEIHARKEPRAIKITQILWKAVEELEATKELQEENEHLKEVHESGCNSLKLIADKGSKLEKRLQKAEQIIKHLLTPAEFATLGRSNNWVVKEAKDFLKELAE